MERNPRIVYLVRVVVVSFSIWKVIADLHKDSPVALHKGTAT